MEASRFDALVRSTTSAPTSIDALRFDALARSLRGSQTRRGLARMLGGLALAGPLALRAPAESAARSRCTDGKHNGKETDIDCGGPKCPRCGIGKACRSRDDCGSALCLNNVCQACTDGQCGSDLQGQCVCNGRDCVKLTPFRQVASCQQCPSGTFCRSNSATTFVCHFYCGATETCAASDDFCADGASRCHDGWCLRRKGGGVRCGIEPGNECVRCQRDRVCRRIYGPGAFCAMRTGTSCGCLGQTSFCAIPV